MARIRITGRLIRPGPARGWAALALALAAQLGSACLPEGRIRPGPHGGSSLHFREERALGGTLYQIDIWADDEGAARAAMDEAFQSVSDNESVVSEWQESSEVSAVNRAAGREPVAVSPELLGVLARALRFSELTEGAFDVTFAGCGRLWSIEERIIPGEEALAQCLEHVNFRRLVLDVERSTVFLRDPDMRIGLGGIGKGYRIDRAAEILARHGISSFVVNGGGDIRVQGSNGGAPWAVRIQHPRDAEGSLGTLYLERGAVVTSGDYSWYFDRDGVRYHHILDPATGRPARRSVSVTVVARSAMDADALATGLFVMGPDKGLALVEKLPGVEALIVGPDLVPRASGGFASLTSPTRRVSEVRKLDAAPAARGLR
ncbi:MAG: FAD:protein FMN transferase [Acidobacteria bacterium]|nr:FAD:protein FMN transferase [Acidobacteriota bacterium]